MPASAAHCRETLRSLVARHGMLTVTRELREVVAELADEPTEDARSRLKRTQAKWAVDEFLERMTEVFG